MAKHTWNNFIGGIGINERVGTEGFYYQGFGIDTLNDPNIVRVGDQGSEATDFSNMLDGGDVVMHKGWAFSDDGIDDFRIDYAGSGGSAAYTFNLGTGGVSAVDLQKTTESGSDFLYYAYVRSGTANVGRASADNRALTSEDDDWYTNVAGGTLNGENPFLQYYEDKLYIIDENNVNEWDITNSSLEEGRLDLPNNIVWTGTHGRYLVFVTNQDNMYLWDGQSISWNYKISLEGELFITGATTNGSLVFLTTSNTNITRPSPSSNGSTEGLKINTIGENLTTYEGLASVNNIIRDGVGNVYYDAISSKDGAYFLIAETDYGDSNTETTLNILKFGAPAKIPKTVSIPHLTNISFSSGAKGGFMFYNGFFYMGAFKASDSPTAYSCALESYESSNADASTLFETDEHSVDTEEGIYTGIAKRVAVYFNSTANNNTKIIPILDGEEQTELTYTASGNETDRIFIDLKRREFHRARVRIEGFVPDVTKIELLYDLNSKA